MATLAVAASAMAACGADEADNSGGAASLVAGRASAEGLPFAPDAEGAVHGVLVTTLLDFADRSETRYTLRAANGAERPLHLDAAADPGLPAALRALASGAPVRVWGTDTSDGLRVSAVQLDVAGLDSHQSALVDGEPFPSRSFAFVLVDTGTGVGITEDQAMGVMLTDPNSMRNFYYAASYGRLDITARVFGGMSFSVTACSETSIAVLSQSLKALIPGRYDHYIWYLGNFMHDCGWLGSATLGTAATPSQDVWSNGSTACNVLIQEPGHNLGMQHSSSLACASAAFADDPNTCTADEYGDIYDPMGGACRDLNAWQKAYQGWFGGCNGVAVTSSGTFTVLPIENRCDGVQFLKVKAPKSRTIRRAAAGGAPASVETLSYYYVELRTPTGFDGSLGTGSALSPQILIHAGDDVRPRDMPGVHTYLLDMTPTADGRGSFKDAALGVGKTFTDPAGGVSITTVAVSSTQATIKVDVTGGIGAPTCLDGTAFVEPGPGPESCGPGMSPGTGGAGAVGTGGTLGGSGGQGGAGAAPESDAGAAGGAAGDVGADDAGTPGEGGGGGDGCGCVLASSPHEGRGAEGADATPGALALLLLGAAATLARRRVPRRRPRD